MCVFVCVCRLQQSLCGGGGGCVPVGDRFFFFLREKNEKKKKKEKPTIYLSMGQRSGVGDGLVVLHPIK